MRHSFSVLRSVRNSWLLYSVIGAFNKRPFDGSRKKLTGNDIIIDGYPRTANTFLTHYFIETFRDLNLRVGHHFHAPAAVYFAGKYGAPAIFTLREPYGAISSFVLYRYGILPGREEIRIAAGQCIDRYRDYVHALRAVSSPNICIFDFEDIIHRPEEVMVYVAGMFRYSYRAEGGNQEEKALKVQEKITKIAASVMSPRSIDLRVPNPNVARAIHKEGVVEVLKEEFQDEVCKAYECYQKIRMRCPIL